VLLHFRLGGKRSEEFGNGGVVTKCLAGVGVSIYIAGAEDEATTELKRILSKTVLPMASFFRAFAGNRIVFAKDVQDRCPLELDSFVGLPLLIDQQGEGDACLFAKDARVVHIAQADRCQTRTLRDECLLIGAQLSHVLTAEDSTIVP